MDKVERAKDIKSRVDFFRRKMDEKGMTAKGIDICKEKIRQLNDELHDITRDLELTVEHWMNLAAKKEQEGEEKMAQVMFRQATSADVLLQQVLR